MWNGLGPHQYTMLRTNTAVIILGSRGEWAIISGRRRNRGLIRYVVECRSGSSIFMRQTCGWDDISEVLGYWVRKDRKWMMVARNRVGPIVGTSL